MSATVDITRILCPVDFSDFSRRALVNANAIAEWYGARVSALYVYPLAQPPLEPAAVTPDLPMLDPGDMLEDLRRFCSSTVLDAANIELVTAPGNPAREIVRQAEQLSADLIVMGTHGGGGFERLFLGSVTEKVLRTASVPVLTVPPNIAEPYHVLFKTILCPVDFSEASLEALEYAFSLAKEADARVVLLHVVEGVIKDLRLGEAAAFTVPEYFAHLQRDALVRLNDLLPQGAGEWCHCESQVVVGKPSSEILRIADDVSAELIVMGVHGHGVVQQWLFGSTTHHVIRHAPCQVLTVRAHTGKARTSETEAARVRSRRTPR